MTTQTEMFPVAPVIKAPMLATGVDMNLLRFPTYGSAKLDGIRCLTLPSTEGKLCRAVSRNLKPIANRFIRQWIEENLPVGLDGELVVMVDGKPGTFQACSSGIMSHGGEPEFRYMVFDHVKDSLKEPYLSRMTRLKVMRLPRVRVMKILPIELNTREELDVYEVKCLAEGHEGVMVRSADSPYKCGRSSVGEGYLLKIKRFADSEAEVIGYFQMMSNTNEATTNVLGYTERSGKGAGMRPIEMLGALKVRDIYSGVEFQIGTGFDHETRKELWRDPKAMIGKVVKYKSQPTGVKDAPRFPVWLGFRDASDMS